MELKVLAPILLLVSATVWGLIYLLKREGANKATAEARKKEAENDARAAREDAQRWADAPVTDDAFERVLSERIDRKRREAKDQH